MAETLLIGVLVLSFAGKMWLWFTLGRRWERKNPARGDEWWLK